MVTLMERVGWFAIFGTTIQVMLLLLFIAFVQYDNVPGATATRNDTRHTWGPEGDGGAGLDVYPMLGDVQVMVLVGFGFLMTFLRRYGHSALGLTLLLVSFALQISLLIDGAATASPNGTVTITIHSLLNGNFAAAAMLISVGAVLGRTSPTQLLFLTLMEVPVYTLNAHICLSVLGIVDHGGSIVIHVFGAFFGLGFSKCVCRKALEPQHPQASSSSTSDTFAMIGSLFLWLYWPSFNAVLVEGAAARSRAVLNTYLALMGSTFCTFIVSSWTHMKNKWAMTHVQNATLAGGVGAGAVAGLILYPWGALLLGCFAGVLSTLGYTYLQGLLEAKLGLQDTCGVLHLHGLPGVFSALVSIGSALFASHTTFGDELFHLYPLLAPPNASLILEMNVVAPGPGEGRSAVHQAFFQLLATGITLLLALVSGACAGLLVTFPVCQPLTPPQQYSDALWWDEAEEDEPKTPTMDVDFPKLFNVQVRHGDTGRGESHIRNGM
ncbi:ammonium transporter Rh type B-like [Eriocheir sinensis]|uniref:ammonium transporter Rh type B-like n=1 Tax=Eriocheir sinensis TaxID=95602 RepID=UPI0021C69FED|nr:ammonium transporter Rh type B-like [Eriocheir sinensis]